MNCANSSAAELRSSAAVVLCALAIAHLFFSTFKDINSLYLLQLLAVDVSAQATMKDAANCDKYSDWQNSANL